MLFFPKPIRKPKARKPLKRRPKTIAKRSVFKAHGDNPLKTYRRRFTDYQVMARAQICRQQRLRNRTRGEMAFTELLDSMGLLCESEAIFLNGDRWVLIDFLVRSAKFAFEIDGSSHDNQKEYDADRDAWLLRVYGVRTVRLTNAQVLGCAAKVKCIVENLLH
jgi:hypothetical protein